MIWVVIIKFLMKRIIKGEALVSLEESKNRNKFKIPNSITLNTFYNLFKEI